METTSQSYKIRLGFDDNERLVRVFESKETKVLVQVPQSVTDERQVIHGSSPDPQSVFEALFQLPDHSQILSVTVLPDCDDTIGGDKPEWPAVAKSSSIYGELYLYGNMSQADLRKTLAYYWALRRMHSSSLIKSNFEIADRFESAKLKIASFETYDLKERFAVLMAVTLLNSDWEHVDPTSGYQRLDSFFEETPILAAVLALVIQDVLTESWLHSKTSQLASSRASFLHDLGEKIDYIKERVKPAAIAKLIEIANTAAAVMNKQEARAAINGAKVLLIQLGNANDFENLNDFSSIVLAGRTVTPDMMSALSEACQLEEIDLSNTRIDDTHLIPVSRLPKLRRIDLSGSSALGSSIVPLVRSNSLRELDLSRTRINDNAISFLAAFSNLERLNLTGTEITDDGAASLHSQLPNCSIIRD